MLARFACVAFLALASTGCAFGPSQSYKVAALSTDEAESAASLISAYRTAHGLSPVAVDRRLNQAAAHQARAVAGAGSLSHGDFASRMAQYGVRGNSAENLTAGSSTVAQAVARWKNSPSHNENLLLPQARYVGLARADSNGPYGRYWALVLSD